MRDHGTDSCWTRYPLSSKETYDEPAGSSFVQVVPEEVSRPVKGVEDGEEDRESETGEDVDALRSGGESVKPPLAAIWSSGTRVDFAFAQFVGQLLHATHKWLRSKERLITEG